MEIFLIFCLIVVLVIRWVLLRDRMARMESRIAELTARVDAQSPAPPPRPQAVAPVVEPPRVAPRGETPRVEPAPVALPAAQPAAVPREWETILGGSWLNKIGVFVLGVGLALLLRYSFTQFGLLGRLAICLAASLSLLAAGEDF